MRAVNFYVIVETVKEEPKKVGGLIFSDKVDEDNRYKLANVISVDNEAVPFIKEGDAVYYDKHAGHNIIYDDKTYRIIKATDIAIVK